MVSTQRERNSDEQFCSSCGVVVKKAAQFCSECGADLRTDPTSTPAPPIAVVSTPAPPTQAGVASPDTDQLGNYYEKKPSDPTKKKKGSKFMVGCLLSFAIVAVIGITIAGAVVFLLTDSDGGSSQPLLGLYPNRPDTQDKDTEIEDGGNGKLGGWEVTAVFNAAASSIPDAGILGGPAIAEDGNRFVIFEVNVKRVGDSSGSLLGQNPFGSEFRLLAPGGQIADPGLEAKSPEFTTGDIVSGGQASGYLTYETPLSPGMHYLLFKPEPFSSARLVWGIEISDSESQTGRSLPKSVPAPVVAAEPGSGRLYPTRPDAQDKDTEIEDGRSGNLGDWEVTAIFHTAGNSIPDAGILGGPAVAEDGNRFVIFEVSAKRVGDGSGELLGQNPFMSEFRLLTPRGQVVDPGLEAKSPEFTTGDMVSGGQASGYLTYETPLSPGMHYLLFKPEPFSSDRLVWGIEISDSESQTGRSLPKSVPAPVVAADSGSGRLYPTRPDAQDKDIEIEDGGSDKLGGWEVTAVFNAAANSIPDAGILGGSAVAEDGNRFVIFEVSAKRVGDGSGELLGQNPFMSEFRLLTPSGQVIDPALEAKSPEFAPGDMVSGAQASGYLTYEAPLSPGMHYLLFKPEPFSTARLVWGIEISDSDSQSGATLPKSVPAPVVVAEFGRDRLYPDRPDAQTADTEIKNGGSGDLGGWRITTVFHATANSIPDAGILGGAAVAEDGNRFVIFEVGASRIGEASSELLGQNPFMSEFRLLTPSGQVVDPALEAKSPEFAPGTMVSGSMSGGYLTYEAPSGAGMHYLLFKPDLFSGPRLVWGIDIPAAQREITKEVPAPAPALAPAPAPEKEVVPSTAKAVVQPTRTQTPTPTPSIVELVDGNATPSVLTDNRIHELAWKLTNNSNETIKVSRAEILVDGPVTALTLELAQLCDDLKLTLENCLLYATLEFGAAISLESSWFVENTGSNLIAPGHELSLTTPFGGGGLPLNDVSRYRWVWHFQSADSSQQGAQGYIRCTYFWTLPKECVRISSLPESLFPTSTQVPPTPAPTQLPPTPTPTQVPPTPTPTQVPPTPTPTQVPPTPTVTPTPTITPTPTPAPPTFTPTVGPINAGSLTSAHLAICAEQGLPVGAVCAGYINVNILGFTPTPTATPTATVTPTPTITATPTPAAILKISFTSMRDGSAEIYMMDPNGSNQSRLTSVEGGVSQPAWSPDRVNIAFKTERDGDSEIYLVKPDGSGLLADKSGLTRFTTSPGLDSSPKWSPDGRRLAWVSGRDGNDEIYIMDKDGSNLTRFTNHTAWDKNPVWSPDGTALIFESVRMGYGNWEIYKKNVDGSGLMKLTSSIGLDTLPAWSPDGSKILFVSERDGNKEIYLMNSDGSNQVRLTNSPGSDTSPSWAPGGSRITFESDRDGNREIYLLNIDTGSELRLTNTSAVDRSAAWSPDGFQITFVSARDGNEDIYVMYSDGTGQTRLTNSSGLDDSPSWSYINP